jgi:sodium transport system ATP-binding protein
VHNNVRGDGVEVRGLTKEFSANGVRAVNDVTFDVAPGEIVGLLGANGAGKTTIVRILATLLRPTSGRVRVGGFDTVHASRAVRASIGVLSGSDAGLYDRLSAGENIRYFAALHGLDRVTCEQRSAELANLFGLHSFIDRLVATYSSGMRQRTALARSVVHDPPFMILDEPTTALDIGTTMVVHDFVARSRKEGKTIILSSHDTTELEQLCDRVLTIDAGRIVDEARRGTDFGGEAGSLRSRFLAMRSEVR